MIKYLVILFATAFVLTGCISVDYKPVDAGVSPAPLNPESVKVYNDPSKLKEQYHTIGYCIVSGNYSDFSKDDLLNKLKEKAAEEGAAGVVIKTYAVVQNESERLAQLTDMQSMNSDVFTEGDVGVNGWNRLSSNFDSGYGSIRDKKSVRVYSYKRIIRANFIEYGPGKKAAPMVKTTEPKAEKKK